jgi:multiple sugar transport system substrate-binding protein
MPGNLGVRRGGRRRQVAGRADAAVGRRRQGQRGERRQLAGVPDKSANKALAYAFVKYANDGRRGKDIRIKGGAFPATTADLTSPAFLDTPFPYFGGQKANEIFAQSAQNVVTGWTYLPFQVYANSIFNDTVGKAYVSSTTLADGLKAWQDQSAKYGTEQGFTVK